jgi:hypothetical protein
VMPCFKCFGCFRRMFSNISSKHCICCNGYIRMLQSYVSFCKHIFQVFHLDVAEVDLDVA